jgi:hypothetical protein
MEIDLRKIPAVYINLEQHPEKHQAMQEMLSRMGFEDIRRIEGVYDADNSIAGCSKAHHKALSDLKAPFLLLEDDCSLFEENFQPVIEIPDNADALYLGISSWGRMNGHNGQYVQYDEFEEHPNLIRIYNMLGGHSIVYFSDFYREMCSKVAYHAGYIIQDGWIPSGGGQDIGFAEIQRFFNVYSLNNPVFYQTSNQLGTKHSLTSFPMSQCMTHEHLQFYPYPIK